VRRFWCRVCALGCAGAGGLWLSGPAIPQRLSPSAAHSRGPAAKRSSISLPVAFEPNVGQLEPQIAFLGRGKGLETRLTSEGLELVVGRGAASKAALRIDLEAVSPAPLSWRGDERLPGESNYLLGNDPRRWRTHVAHYSRAVATTGDITLAVYGNDEGIEYDLRLQPGADASKLRLKLSGADTLRLDKDGDLRIVAGGQEIHMRRPVMYEDRGRGLRRRVEGGYIVEPDSTIKFRLGPRDPRATLVIDPSLSVGYSTFLGGTGQDSANSIAMDSKGKIYIAGTTTSATTFPEGAGTTRGPGGGIDFFVAKIDPTQTSSLVYLTFLGGSGDEAGGIIAVDAKGDAIVIAGTTTSSDYPVTDGSKRTSGPNDVAVSEIDQKTGAMLVLSTLFGGSGAEATQGAGGIAVDGSGDIFIASDTTSTDLPVTSGAFRSSYGGGVSDGFLAEFAPGSTATSPPTVKYCTYLGIDAQVGVGGIALDSDGNVYLAGFTSDPGTTFPSTTNALPGQSTYGGGDFDAFLLKIRPSGNNASDLSYATFLGGSGSDQAFAVQVGTSLPGTAYVTGTTSSMNFPISGTVTGYQTKLNGVSNAFLAVVAQSASGTTSLAYSTYLGGSASDAGLSVAVTAANSVYVAGNATSPDPAFWLDNFQPFTGDQDAFVAKFDPTSAGNASLLYSTPLGGTAPVGLTATTQGNSVVADGAGHVYLAGETTSGDFPSAGNPGNGFQLTCTSSSASPPAGDAFLVEIVEGASAEPSVSFSAAKLNFGATPVGSQNAVPQPAAVVNTGDADLLISGHLAIAGTNAGDFSFSGAGSCADATLAQGANCSFEVGFTPSTIGPEQAFVVVTDNSPNGQPGNTQALELVGTGDGPLAALSPANVDFGNVPDGATSNSMAVTLTNSGTVEPLIISNGPILAGPDAVNFQITGATSCVAGAPIAPSGSCQTFVTFAPNALRQFQAQINFFDNSLNLPSAEQVAPLTGTGTAAAPVASLAPAALSFGSQSVGMSSGAQVVTLSNLGSASLNISSIGLGGANAADFGIVPAGTACPTTSGSIPIGGSCTVAVSFAPQSAGAKSASLSFNDNAAGSPQTVALTGTAVGPQIQFSAGSLNFGAQTVGTTSAAQSIALSNPGSVALVISSVSVTGANASDFVIAANTCPPSIGVGGSCSVSITFRPTAAGNRAAALSVADNAAASPQTLALTGTATQAGVTTAPTSVNFGSQLVASGSAAVPVNVTNTGLGTLVISKISFTGANSGDFAETDNCTGTGVSILSNATCTIQATFKPTSSGARSAALTLTDNAPDSPESVALSGTGMDFALAPASGGPTSATVTAGQTAMYQLDVNSSNGFAGMVPMSCSGAPAAAVCTVNPKTVTVTANAPAAFGVSVSTTARTSGSALNTPALLQRTSNWRAATLLAGWGLILVWASRCRAARSRRQPLARWAQGAALVALLAAALAACSSGGGVASGTPAGTYTLTITGATGGTSRTIPLTLIVQ